MPLIRSQLLSFERVDDTLQAFTEPEGAGLANNVAKLHRWYLTADYSTDPPLVRLTKEPEKYSHWLFEPRSDHPFETLNTIRNLNDSGKPAWLTLSEKAKWARFAGKGGSAVALFDPVLSYNKDKKQLFDIRRDKRSDDK